MDLNNNIKALRTASKLSQEYIAEQLGVSRQAVSNWETGLAIPSTDNLIALSVLFHVTVEELIQPNLSQLANDDTRTVVRVRKRWIFTRVCFLFLMIVLLSAALYARGQGDQTVLLFVVLAVLSMLCGLLPFYAYLLKLIRILLRK